jgi:hypothetical protein
MHLEDEVVDRTTRPAEHDLANDVNRFNMVGVDRGIAGSSGSEEQLTIPFYNSRS